MSIGKIKEFDIKNGTWTVYADRLDMYFKVNKINEDTRLPTLIAVMGDEAYELLCNLASPKKPSELTYVTAVELLRQHLEPTPSVLAERYRFRQRRQGMEENIATYVAELKKLARHCKFKEGLNENLRDQFICGLRSDIIRQRLFSEADTITYTDAIRLAISLEAAERDAAAVEATTCSEKSVDDGKSGALPEQAMHALTSGGDDYPRSTLRQKRLVRTVTARHSSWQHAGSKGSVDRNYNCYGCGATEHDYSVCRFRNYICSNCKREGHLRRVCPDRARAARRAATGAAVSRRSRMNYGAAQDDNTDEGSPAEDLHHLCLDDYRADETIGISCLSSLTRILNNTFNKKFYEEEDSNKQEKSCNKFRKTVLSNKTHDVTNEKLNRRNLKKNEHKTIDINKDGLSNDIPSSINTKDLRPEEENKGLNVELKVECNDIIKQENNCSENEDIDYNDDIYDYDNSVDDVLTDNCKVECKVKDEENINSTLKKANVSLSYGVNKRRKYAKYATITRKENISTRNYKEICQTVYLSQEEYNELVLKRERDRLGNRLQYKCEECQTSFLKNIDLLRHINFVHNKSSYPQKCGACKAMISSEENLSQHWTQAHTVMLRCMLCYDLMRSVADMKRHIRDIHIQTYTCNTCGFACSTFMEFSKHYKTHEAVTCDHCGSSFRKKSTLIKHIKCTHTPIICTICNHQCSNKKRFKYHSHMYHPETIEVETSKELSYCVECDKQFPSVLKYQKHLYQSVKHTPRVYARVPCPECGKIFSRTNFMRNHYRFAHLKKTKNYCEKCKKYYTTGFGLRQHIERVHNKIPIPKNKICDLCGRGFATNRILTNHRRTHTGEKPFKCVYCPASFAQQIAMKTHQKTQHRADKLITSLK